MIVAAPVYGERIAPSFSHCSDMLIARVEPNHVAEVDSFDTRDLTEDERVALLERNEVTILVCGGIPRDLMSEIQGRAIEVINNVAGNTMEALSLLANDQLRSGFGIIYRIPPGSGASLPPVPSEGQGAASGRIDGAAPDCVACQDRICLEGSRCPVARPVEGDLPVDEAVSQIMEVSADIGGEPERVLCRITELIYFCLGMKHKHLGLVFCKDLFGEAETVASLLRRFFRVTPVCCRFGGAAEGQNETRSGGACNPVATAGALNYAETDLNVIVGLCMGCDVAFAQTSDAPVTTLFVKDRLLANNPIGAVHSPFVLDRIFPRAS